MQVGHEVLVERADQHVEGPLALLGKRRCLQCGFFSIDYCKTSEKNKTNSPSRSLETSPAQLCSFLSSHLTNKKSLNSWWSVNTGGDGRGGPNSGTLSSENIFNLHITRNNMATLISEWVFFFLISQQSIRGVLGGGGVPRLTCNCHSGCCTELMQKYLEGKSRKRPGGAVEIDIGDVCSL